MPQLGWHKNRAKEALEKMGLDADPRALGQWGYNWWQAVREDRDHPVDGALITPDGKVVGEVRRARDGYRLTDETMEQHGVTASILDMGTAEIARKLGGDVYLVKAYEVAPGRPIPPRILRDIEEMRREAWEKQNLMEHKAIDAFHRREELGVTVKQIADAMGYKTTQAVYDLVGRGAR